MGASSQGQLDESLRMRDPPSKIGIIEAFRCAESGLKRYLMRFLVRRQDIEDVVQETFLRAWESEKTHQIDSPESYLYTVARNIALSELSRKSHQLLQYMGDFEDLGVIDDGLSIEEDCEIHRKLSRLSCIIESLPPKCQRVLIMRKVLGFSHKEIARRMNISTRTVEKHLTKGLKHCQESMSNTAVESQGEVVRAGGLDE